jgi:uncharacterized membrane protein YeaQ/YmgE (transglycosylase-associated protein family)
MMLTFIGYGLVFIAIGLLAGLVSRRYMPGGGASHYRGHLVAGILGAMLGGIACLATMWYVWNRNKYFPEGGAYERVDPGGTHLPAYWISLFISGLISLLALGVYKLMLGRNRSA